ncbi:MAG: AAA family ATPase [Candidatus Omnitrophota bacterium]
MSYTIAIAGKGGVGKTTTSSLLIKLLAKIATPVLAVDADPNSNLNTLLGLDYTETIADIREEAKNLNSLNMSKSDFFNMKIEEAISEGKGIDLLVMGRPEGSGCYCAVNNILREYLSKISKSYRFVVIDNEAGMEHLSRRTASNIDQLVLVSDPTAVGLRSAVNAYNTVKKAGIKVEEFSLIINKAKEKIDSKKEKIIEEAGLVIDGYLPYQEQIVETSEKGNIMEVDNDIGDLPRLIEKIVKKVRA